MSILQKTIKFDMKLKNIALSDEPGVVVNEDGELVDLWSSLEKAYGQRLFNLTTTLTDTEQIDLDLIDTDNE